ncbi:MAG: segregation and condensation protein A [Candidatus Howiella sp.]
MDKLSYSLEGFEGPLDLLLYLISKHQLNIYDINLTELLEQYTAHIRAMEAADMEVASEFLEMASRLVYLKTVSLLPKHDEAEQLREELTGELLEYQTCRKMAAVLGSMTEGFGCFVRPPEPAPVNKTYARRHEAAVLLDAYLAAVGRGQRRLPPPTTVFSKIVAKKIVSVSSRIVHVLRGLWNGKKEKFSALFSKAESRSELVATFLAVLELVKARRVAVSGEGEDATVRIVKEKH